MISDSDIVNGYMWLLGRIPTEADLAVYRARFSDGGPDAVRSFQYELLASEEFRNRRLLMQRMHHLGRPALHQDRLAFVHIEKCGGTTLHAMLCGQFAPERICPERNASLGDWTVNELAAYQLFSGHFDLAYCRSIPGTVRVLTMLREPKARLLSLYRFWKAHRPDRDRDFYDLLVLARSCSAEAFFAHPRVTQHPALRDGMAGQLTRSDSVWALLPGHPIIDDPDGTLQQAWAALEAMAAFGILEAFEQSRRLFNHRLGLALTPIAPRQVLSDLVRDNAEMVALELEPMTPRLDALLDAMTPIDRPLYARARALFERRVAEMDAPEPVARRRLMPSRASLPGSRRWRGR